MGYSDLVDGLIFFWVTSWVCYFESSVMLLFGWVGVVVGWVWAVSVWGMGVLLVPGFVGLCCGRWWL